MQRHGASSTSVRVLPGPRGAAGHHLVMGAPWRRVCCWWPERHHSCPGGPSRHHTTATGACRDTTCHVQTNLLEVNAAAGAEHRALQGSARTSPTRPCSCLQPAGRGRRLLLGARGWATPCLLPTELQSRSPEQATNTSRHRQDGCIGDRLATHEPQGTGARCGREGAAPAPHKEAQAKSQRVSTGPSCKARAQEGPPSPCGASAASQRDSALCKACGCLGLACRECECLHPLPPAPDPAPAPSLLSPPWTPSSCAHSPPLPGPACEACSPARPAPLPPAVLRGARAS